MSVAATDALSLINVQRLEQEMDAAGLDAIVAASPENVFYFSGAFIRTQVSIRDRLAVVVWPRRGEPALVVCDIEQTLVEKESWIHDVRVYVEFARSPISVVIEALRDRGVSFGRIGIERRFLSAEYHDELTRSLRADYVAADRLLERVRAIKTPEEQFRIRSAFLATEEATRAAWATSRAGDTERLIADRMAQEAARRGADGVRHMTLAIGENTVHPHGSPGGRKLTRGDLVLTDWGATWRGFNSDMARMGVCGSPDPTVRAEFAAYRAAYVDTLRFLAPGVSAAAVFQHCAQAFQEHGIELRAPHVGHSLSRGGGHENPLLHPYNDQKLESGMMIALEPTYRPPGAPRRYHLEDLILITREGTEIITDWDSTAHPIEIEC